MKITKQNTIRTMLLLIILLLIYIPKPSNATTIDAPLYGCDTTQPYYLFCFFRDQHQGMCYAISTDGYFWQPLNNNQPYLVPKIGKEKLMRDPSINLGPDGIYRVVWTTGWHGNSIGFSSSKDLIHWNKERLLPVMKDIEGVKHCWAPEIFYDDLKQQYMVFWSSPVDTVWSIYYTVTKDFKRFSQPKILFSNGLSGGGKAGDNGVIDAFIFKDTAHYILFYKKDDNTGVPNIYYRFGKTPYGPWAREIGPIVPSTGEEGPSCIKVGNQYRVYTDPFESHDAYLYNTTDLKHWKQIHTNLKMSHGTVLKISAERASHLMNSTTLKPKS